MNRKQIVIMCLFLFPSSEWATGALVDFRDLNGVSLGEMIDGLDPAVTALPVSFNIPALSPLLLTVEGITSSAGSVRLNPNSSSLGLDSSGAGSTGDNATRFDANLSDTVTFSLSQAVEITELDFVGFADTDTFSFGSLSIGGTDTRFGANDVLDLSATPLNLAAGESFTLAANIGTIGFQDMTFTVIAVPESSPFALLCTALIGGVVIRRRLSTK